MLEVLLLHDHQVSRTFFFFSLHLSPKAQSWQAYHSIALRSLLSPVPGLAPSTLVTVPTGGSDQTSGCKIFRGAHCIN